MKYSVAEPKHCKDLSLYVSSLSDSIIDLKTNASALYQIGYILQSCLLGFSIEGKIKMQLNAAVTELGFQLRAYF